MRAVPMETKSLYQSEYVEKPVIPVSLRPLKNPTKDSRWVFSSAERPGKALIDRYVFSSSINITDPTAAIASQTTTRSHFKSWQSAPAQPYTELPAVAGKHLLLILTTVE